MSAEAIYDRIVTDMRRYRQAGDAARRRAGRHPGARAGPMVDARRRDGPGRLLPPLPQRRGSPTTRSRAAGCLPGRAGGGDPRPGPAADPVGCGAGAVVRPTTSRRWRSAAPTPGPAAASPPRRTSLGRAGCPSRTREDGAHLRRGAGHLRLDGPRAAGQGAGRHRELQPGPRGARRAASSSATPWPTTRATWRRRPSPSGCGSAAGAARCSQPGIDLLEQAEDFPKDGPDPDHHRRGVRRLRSAASTPSCSRRAPASPSRARAGLPGSLRPGSRSTAPGRRASRGPACRRSSGRPGRARFSSGNP